MMNSINQKFISSANVILFFACVAALCLPAALNGFPLVFFDTVPYLWPTKSAGHPPYYGFVLLILHPAISLCSLFLVPALQSVTVTGIIYIAFKKLIPSAATTSVLLGSLIVVLLSQLPWLASWIMTDVWLGVGILGILAVGISDNSRSLNYNVGIGLLVLFSALVATSSILVFATEMITIITIRWMLKHTDLHKFTKWCTVLLALSFAIPMTVNYIFFGKFRLNVATNALLLSRAVDLGLAQHYKKEACTQFDAAFCEEFAALPAGKSQPFLWSSGLASRYDAWIDPKDKFGGLVRLIIKDRWQELMQSGLVDAWSLFLNPTLGNHDLSSQIGFVYLEDRIRKHYSGQLGKFRDAAQQRGRLKELFPRTYYTWWTYFSYLVCLVFSVVSWYKKDSSFLVAGAAILVVITVNIVIHASLVGPFSRYHTKVSWLPTFYITAWMIAHSSSRVRTQLF